jgi:phage antirepressor YoqD-like protein
MEFLPKEGTIRIADLAKFCGVKPDTLVSNLINSNVPIFKAGKTRDTWLVRLDYIGREPKA